ncbi:MAG: phosphoenolpyruvate carboxykinase (GTP) [bacterium]|nr:phosphoenolpyruvate carboxykinase (GTP) [bacterium]
MEEKYINLLKEKCTKENFEKLMALDNSYLHKFIEKYIEHCNPSSIFVRTDHPDDAQYARDKAIENGEEMKLAIKGHTNHFDSYYDQGRDKESTKYLLSPGVELGKNINSIDKETGLSEIYGYLKNSMEGKEAYICFFCLGPVNSIFSIPGVQITDSSYVVHSEGILYRSGYQEFKRIANSDKFFKIVHSAGELEGNVCKNTDKRKIYIDLDNFTVYSANTQYAGNTVGFKKLSLRLAIHKAAAEGWLAEHMLILGVNGPSNRTTYFTGAFPSACGKTSTAMLEGESIAGDDLAYLRKKDGKIYAANVECGIFGIIKDVNPKDDPLIWKVLNSPGDVIFSNVLIAKDNQPYWLCDGRNIPDKGINFSGNWFKGKKDNENNEILHAHPNARYTVSLYSLENCDPKLDDPDGFEIKGIIYGGRDSDTLVPVQQSFDWVHGVITMGAALESETTAATLGKVGVRTFNPMSNLDFVAIPIGQYIQSHLDFASDIKNPPSIFAVNYFQKDKEGNFMTGMNDKHVWIKWMELRVNGDVEAIETPTGYIPKYEDLKILFKEVLNKEYEKNDYEEQFRLRIPENIKKLERIEDIYRTKVDNTPNILFQVLNEQKQRLIKVAKEITTCCT